VYADEVPLCPLLTLAFNPAITRRSSDASNHLDADALWKIWPSVPAKTRQAIEASSESRRRFRRVNATVTGQFSQVFTSEMAARNPRVEILLLKKSNRSWAQIHRFME
jgi:hypothetical protein